MNTERDKDMLLMRSMKHFLSKAPETYLDKELHLKVNVITLDNKTELLFKLFLTNWS